MLAVLIIFTTYPRQTTSDEFPGPASDTIHTCPFQSFGVLLDIPRMYYKSKMGSKTSLFCHPTTALYSPPPSTFSWVSWSLPPTNTCKMQNKTICENYCIHLRCIPDLNRIRSNIELETRTATSSPASFLILLCSFFSKSLVRRPIRRKSGERWCRCRRLWFIRVLRQS